MSTTLIWVCPSFAGASTAFKADTSWCATSLPSLRKKKKHPVVQPTDYLTVLPAKAHSVQVKGRSATCTISNYLKPTVKLYLSLCISGHAWYRLSLRCHQKSEILLLVPWLSLAAPEFKGNHPWKLITVLICSWLTSGCLATSLTPSVNNN